MTITFDLLISISETIEFFLMDKSLSIKNTITLIITTAIVYGTVTIKPTTKFNPKTKELKKAVKSEPSIMIFPLFDGII